MERVDALLRVVVAPGDGKPLAGTIVIEPATGRLAVGEGRDLRVFLVSDSGTRVDRTGSATLQAANDGVLAVSGNRIVGVAAGNSEVTATLVGSATPGKASFGVEDERYTKITVSPPSIRLGTREVLPIHIGGNGPGGLRELSRHPDLTVTLGGQNPKAVEWNSDAGTLRGIAPGKATLNVKWRDLAAEPVPIEVSGDMLTKLRVRPSGATIGVGERAPLLVFAMQGARQKSLTAEDGVELQVADTSVAKDRWRLDCWWARVLVRRRSWFG